MSAFGGKADIEVKGFYFRFLTKADTGSPKSCITADRHHPSVHVLFGRPGLPAR